MLPPLNSLRVFETVARHMSFTAAADELNVSASAASHQVRNLEDFFAVRLIVRSGPRITLTEEGKALADDMTSVMRLLRNAVASFQSRINDIPLGVSLTPHFALKWLAPRLTRLWGKYPGFNMRFYHSVEPADFSSNEVHVSIEWRHISDLASNCKLLIKGKLTPGFHPSYLKGDSPIKNPADLLDHTLLHSSFETQWREWFDLAGVDAPGIPDSGFYGDTNVRNQAAIDGEGITLVNPALSQDDISAGNLICPFDFMLETYSYYIVLPQEQTGNISTGKFIDWLYDEAALSV